MIMDFLHSVSLAWGIMALCVVIAIIVVKISK